MLSRGRTTHSPCRSGATRRNDSGGRSDRARQLVEPELGEAQALVVVAPEVAGLRVGEQRRPSVAGTVEVGVEAQREHFLADVLEARLARAADEYRVFGGT